jgi:hypothetical protein
LPTPTAPANAWLRSPFAAGAGLALVGVLLLGWFTSMRGVMHGVLIRVGASAPIPFAVAAGLAAVFAAGALASALLADAATPARLERAAAGGSRLSRSFFAQVQRQQQHPFLWGAGSGLALGLVGIWLVLAALVVPLDMGSLDLLLFSKVRIDAAHPSGSLPTPSDGLLHPSAWNAQPDAEGSAALDNFGRPIHLEHDRAGTYELRSLGLDGKTSADDLCVRGPGLQAPALVRDPLAFLERRRANAVGWVDQVNAIQAARCTESITTAH